MYIKCFVNRFMYILYRCNECEIKNWDTMWKKKKKISSLDEMIASLFIK